jgi:hypothetical protein
MRFWPQHEHQTVYAISLLKHDVVVLRKSQGPQKWLAPCRTDVHRVACTIDVCILEKESHRQNSIIMRKEVLIAQNMENLSVFVCIELIFTRAREASIAYVDFCHVLLYECAGWSESSSC